MKRLMIYCLGISSLFCLFSTGIARPLPAQPLEGLGLSASNAFRLALYAELKGQQTETANAYLLPFGSLGSFAIYPGHCLLKTNTGQCLSVDRYEFQPAHASLLNEALDQLLDQIHLLANPGAPTEVLAYVDQHLPAMQIGAFEKLYARHLLLKYGRWGGKGSYLWLHTDWLPDSVQTMISGQEKALALVLRPGEMRGFFLENGAQVYVKRKQGNKAYTSGVETGSNANAFELFLSRLMLRTVHYVAPTPVKAAPVSHGIRPLYSDKSWIPMMLGLLRANQVNVGDPDVICHFRADPLFPLIVAQMTPEERKRSGESGAGREERSLR